MPLFIVYRLAFFATTPFPERDSFDGFTSLVVSFFVLFFFRLSVFSNGAAKRKKISNEKATKPSRRALPMSSSLARSKWHRSRSNNFHRIEAHVGAAEEPVVNKLRRRSLSSVDTTRTAWCPRPFPGATQLVLFFYFAVLCVRYYSI